MISTTIKSVATAAALLVAGGIPTHAESAFQTLAGVEAEPMNAVEMGLGI